MIGLIGLAAAALFGTAQAIAAQTEISVLYASPDVFRPIMDDLAQRFMAANPDIKVVYRAPAPEYEQVLQTVLRESVVGTQPDVVMQGLNRIRALADQGLATQLDPLIAAETDFAAKGFNPTMLDAGKVQGKTYALPFAVSLPVLYYNADLVKRAGGDPAHLPQTWDGVIGLARKIEDLDKASNGIVYAWDMTGNWMWQSLVFSRGGAMLDPTEKKVLFGGAEGQWAIGEMGRIVTQGGMPYLAHNAAREQFAAGGLGIFATSAAQLAIIEKMTAGKFPVVVGAFPELKAGVSKLPAGGNGLMITARDPAKQKAAWRFLTFVTSAEQAADVAKRTGYFPPNDKATLLMKDFYDANPNFAVAVSEQPYITGWYAFPGENGLKITDIIKDKLETVTSGTRAAAPEQVLSELVSEVKPLLP
jgi:multiple sugar transport system substrate-binding protein